MALHPDLSGNEDAVSGIKPDRQVAVTFDDLPAPQGGLEEMAYVTKRLLAELKTHGIPAVGFVNERKLYVPGEMDERTALLKMWLDAGQEIGNHTFSHPFIDRVSLAEYQEDVIRGETISRMLLKEEGLTLRYFRHPHLRTGPTPAYKKSLDAFLAGRGYTIAPVTIDNGDYIFAHIYRLAKQHGDRDTMKRVVTAYLAYMDGIFAFFEDLSMDVLGYEVPQVLLLHASLLNADHFDDLVRILKRRGYRFVTLEEALKDKAYGLPDGVAARGLSWLHRWAKEKGMKTAMEPDVPEPIMALFRAERRGDD
jgi:peptidoglycan/xylan/chitin deacetylase (PgdA/CDA1 family)